MYFFYRPLVGSSIFLLQADRPFFLSIRHLLPPFFYDALRESCVCVWLFLAVYRINRLDGKIWNVCVFRTASFWSRSIVVLHNQQRCEKVRHLRGRGESRMTFVNNNLLTTTATAEKWTLVLSLPLQKKTRRRWKRRWMNISVTAKKENQWQRKAEKLNKELHLFFRNSILFCQGYTKMQSRVKNVTQLSTLNHLNLNLLAIWFLFIKRRAFWDPLLIKQSRLWCSNGKNIEIQLGLLTLTHHRLIGTPSVLLLSD